MDRKDKFFYGGIALFFLALAVFGSVPPTITPDVTLQDGLDKVNALDILEDLDSMADACVTWSANVCDRETCEKGLCVIWTEKIVDGQLPNGDWVDFELGIHQLQLVVWRERYRGPDPPPED